MELNWAKFRHIQADSRLKWVNMRVIKVIWANSRDRTNFWLI